MQRSYTLYTPNTTISDIYEPDIQAHDVDAISPYARVGALLDNMKQRTYKTSIDTALPVSKAPAEIFAFNAATRARNSALSRTSPVRKSSDTNIVSLRSSAIRVMAGFVAAVGDRVSDGWSAIRLQLHKASQVIVWAPKRYSVDKGLRTNTSTNSFRFAKIAVPVSAAWAITIGIMAAVAAPVGIISVMGSHPPKTETAKASSVIKPDTSTAAADNSTSSNDGTNQSTSTNTSATTQSPVVSSNSSTASVLPIGGSGGGSSASVVPVAPSSSDTSGLGAVIGGVGSTVGGVIGGNTSSGGNSTTSGGSASSSDPMSGTSSGSGTGTTSSSGSGSTGDSSGGITVTLPGTSVDLGGTAPLVQTDPTSISLF